MIKTKEVKVKRIENLSSEYIESELKTMGFDVLRWAITSFDDKYYLLNIAIVDNKLNIINNFS